MYRIALACDYDGTLADDGILSNATRGALKSIRESGRRVLMVTGRELPDLKRVCPELTLFDLIVAENGALLYDPHGDVETPLAAAPPDAFTRALAARNVQPLSVGRVIVATREPHEQEVLDAVRALGLELQIIFNKGAVMVLPTGVNKASGLEAALAELGISPHNVVAVGDGENDHALLALAGCAVAVNNAVPMLKEAADFVTSNSAGKGVIELIDGLLANDLADIERSVDRERIPLGQTSDGTPVTIPPFGASILLSGTSGGGKSTLASGFLEQLVAQHYQFCAFDPEGDYESIEGAVILGSSDQPPTPDEILAQLEQPSGNVIVNLVAVAMADRPAFLGRIMPEIQALRARTARPHWLVLDEAHHMLDADWDPASLSFPHQTKNLLVVTVEPDRTSPRVLREIDALLLVGKRPEAAVESFCRALGEEPPALPGRAPENDEALLWQRTDALRLLAANRVAMLTVELPKPLRRRHMRKYAEGDLGETGSFYFRGADRRLNLRAHNLTIFLQMADGVDDETWLYHLRAHDYSAWLRNQIKNAELADEVSAFESDMALDARQSRQRIRTAIESHYRGVT